MKSLKNKYYAFRHGQSMANVKGIIISDPAVGTVEYGLTEEGRLQAKRGAAALADELEADALIYASDFRRAAETAEIVREMLGVEQIIFDERLRERFFGEWEGEPHEYYSKAWKRDAHDSNHEFNGVESTNAVRSRMWAVIQSLEKQHAGRTIILVSHGDPLMLLETAFLEMDPKNHRTLPYFETAGWRALNS
ncbi:MAG: histidine phosphatase family protein, partial [Kiritimatiellaceae bacterium]|nr:histidine phosphatase family protein [Kiritimatiellaceae bacterium]